MNEIRARVERHEYEIDASKVAAAIIERLLLGHFLPGADQGA